MKSRSSAVSVRDTVVRHDGVPAGDRARFGNAGFNSMRGPGFANFDMSVFRQFSLGRARTLQFRLEIFNVTNTPHFANPSGKCNCERLRHHRQHCNSGREGIDERLFRVGLRLGF